jgi:hypothetical protein
MTPTATKTQVMLAQAAVILIVTFAVAGLVLHGFSSEARARVFQSIVDRPGGPMTFRFILQPVMAMVMAAIDGIRDARSGLQPYFWSMVANPEARVARLYEGVISTSRILLLGLGMDVIYQLMVFKTFYPGEAAIVAVLLAFVPYLLTRGPFARLARLWLRHDAAKGGK